MPRFERNRFSTGAVVQNHSLRFDGLLARGFGPILVSWVHCCPCPGWLLGYLLGVVRCHGEYFLFMMVGAGFLPHVEKCLGS